MADRPDVSIVVPLFNEEESVGPLCEAIRNALESWQGTYELLLVDDGSSDRTRARVLEEAVADPRIRVLAMRRNSGQTQAMAAGFARSRGEVIVSMDGDLQNDPADIPLLVSRIRAGFDVVCGWRKSRQDAWLTRTLPSKIANGLIAKMTGIKIHDNGCSLKAYRSEVIRTLRLYSEMHRFLPALSSMTGARIDEVVVRHHPRLYGESKYGLSRTFKVMGDMITIKMLTQFSSRPGLWFGLLSLPWFLVALLALGAWFMALFAEGAGSTLIYSSLVFTFLYLAGHMMSLSVLSEMILANADRRYLRQLAEVLTVGESSERSTARGGSS